MESSSSNSIEFSPLCPTLANAVFVYYAKQNVFFDIQTICGDKKNYHFYRNQTFSGVYTHLRLWYYLPINIPAYR